MCLLRKVNILVFLKLQKQHHTIPFNYCINYLTEPNLSINLVVIHWNCCFLSKFLKIIMQSNNNITYFTTTLNEISLLKKQDLNLFYKTSKAGSKKKLLTYNIGSNMYLSTYIYLFKYRYELYSISSFLPSNVSESNYLRKVYIKNTM